MRPVFPAIVFIIVSVVLTGCPSRQQGTIQGTVTPATADARVTVRVGTTTMASSSPDAKTGAFSMTIAPGTYDIAIASPSSPFPVSLSGIIVEPGKSVSVGVVRLAPVRGTAVITGRIAGGKAVRVSVLADGRERASAAADSSGRYELKELPAGSYTLQVQAQDYAGDARAVVLGDGQRAVVDIRLLYVTALDGVDWARGSLRVRGVGSPPTQAPTPTVRRELAKRAALAEAERNLLRVMAMIETDPGKKASDLLGQSTYSQKLEGWLRGFHVAAERDLEGGRVEIEIELPLTGPGGLSSYLPAE